MASKSPRRQPSAAMSSSQAHSVHLLGRDARPAPAAQRAMQDAQRTAADACRAAYRAPVTWMRTVRFSWRARSSADWRRQRQPGRRARSSSDLDAQVGPDACRFPGSQDDAGNRHGGETAGDEAMQEEFFCRIGPQILVTSCIRRRLRRAGGAATVRFLLRPWTRAAVRTPAGAILSSVTSCMRRPSN